MLLRCKEGEEDNSLAVCINEYLEEKASHK